MKTRPEIFFFFLLFSEKNESLNIFSDSFFMKRRIFFAAPLLLEPFCLKNKLKQIPELLKPTLHLLGLFRPKEAHLGLKFLKLFHIKS